MFHVAWRGVAVYALWAGADLPTESEWELAARGGLDDAEFAWGDAFEPDERPAANTWQGQFPYQNMLEDGWVRTSPVGTYPANGYGLVDMIGNTWGVDQGLVVLADHRQPDQGLLRAQNPLGGVENDSIDPRGPARISRKVRKGGSHLRAPSYCRRYRPAARHAQPIDTSTSHVGFR